MEPYPPWDSYNFDGTALYFRQEPSYALGTGQSSGYKEAKTRISIGFCVNADGSDRRQPLLIGHFERPHAFMGKSPAAHGLECEFNTNVWMIGGVWQSYVVFYGLGAHIPS